MSSASAMTKARRDVYAKMTPAAKKLADSIAERRIRGQSLAVMISYDIGLEIATALGDESVYGAHIIEQLAAYLYPGETGGPSRLYNLRSLTQAFDRDFVEKWTNKQMGSGDTLKLSHWFELMKVEDKKQQIRLLESVIADSKSVQDLEDEIRAGLGGNTKHARQGGRKPKVPNNPVLILQRSAQIANSFNNFDKEAMDKMFVKFEDISPDKVDKGLLDRMHATDTTYAATEKALGKARTRLGKVIDRVERIVAKKPAEKAEGNGKPAPKAAPKTAAKKAKV